MKTYLLPIAIVSLAASALAGAQTPPTSPATGDTSSSSSTQAPSSTTSSSTTSSSSYSNGMDSKAQMKDCVAKQKAANAQLSDADAKRACGKSDSTK